MSKADQTNDDNTSVGSASLEFDGELGSQISGLVERVEKNSAYIKHLRKVVRFLRTKIESDEAQKAKERSEIANASTSPVKILPPNQIPQELLNKFVDKSYFKGKMLEISTKITEIAEQKAQNSPNSFAKFEDQINAQIQKQIEKEFENRIEIIFKKQKSSIEKIQAQNDELSSKFNEFRNNVNEGQSTDQINSQKYGEIKNMFEEFRQNELNELKMQFEQFKESLKEDILNQTIHQKSLENDIIKNFENSNEETKMNDIQFNSLKQTQKLLYKEIKEIKKKINEIENSKIHKNEINSIQNEFSIMKRKIEYASEKVKDIENQIKSENKQRKEIENKLSSEITNIKSKVEKNDSFLNQKLNEMKEILEKQNQINTEIKNQIQTKANIEKEENEEEEEEDLNNTNGKKVLRDLKLNEFMKKVNQKLNDYEKSLDNALQMYADALTDTVNLLKASNDQLDTKMGLVNERNNEVINEVADLKGRMYNTFVSMNGLDSIKQKHKNFKESVRIMISELHSQIEEDRSTRITNDSEFREIFKKLDDSFTEFQRSYEEHNKINNEQIKKQNQQIAAILSQTNGNESDMATIGSDVATIAAEFSLEFEQVKAKLEHLGEKCKVYKEDINKHHNELEEHDFRLKDLGSNLVSRLRNIEMISSTDREEFMTRMNELEDKIESTTKELCDCPRIVAQSVDANQMAIGELSQKIENELMDMKSQLQQASFADEEIFEIKEHLKQKDEEIKQAYSKLNGRLDSIEFHCEKRKSNDQETAKIWNEIENMKTEIEVQKKLATLHTQIQDENSDQYSNDNNGNNKGKKKSENINQTNNKGDNTNDNNDKIDDKNDSVKRQNVAIDLNIASDIEMLKIKIQNLENNLKNQNNEFSNIHEEIQTSQFSTKKVTEQLKIEVFEKVSELKNLFVDAELFDSLKQEFQILHQVVNTQYEANIENNQKIFDRINDISAKIVTDKNPEKISHENIENLQKIDDNNHPKVNESFGANENNNSESHIPGNQENSLCSPSSASEVNELRLTINGIDMATQRQIRKLKTQCKKIERMLEDAVEEEKRKEELARIQKEEEETQKIKRRKQKEAEKALKKQQKLQNQIQTSLQLPIPQNHNLKRMKKLRKKEISNSEKSEIEKLNNNTLENGEEEEEYEYEEVSEGENDDKADESEIVVKDSNPTIKPRRQLYAYLNPKVVKLPTSIELIQDDFQIFFVLMFSCLMYFLVSDVFV